MTSTSVYQDDEELVALLQEGEREAFETLVYRHSRRFYRLAYRFVSDKEDAEDIVQEAFLKLWNNPELWDLKKQTKFTTWFYKVVTNLCLDSKKKKKPFQLPEGMDVQDRKNLQPVILERRRKKHLVESLIGRLPERQQTAINLCFYEGLSNKEAADIIGVKLKALQSLIMRAKITLKDKIREHEDGGLP